MIRNTAKVVTDALSLPPRSRTRLADKLLDSLSHPRQREFDKLWAEEAEDRIDAFERREIRVISGKAVFGKFKTKIKRPSLPHQGIHKHHFYSSTGPT